MHRTLRSTAPAVIAVGLSLGSPLLLAQTSEESEADLRRQVRELRQQLERLEKKLEQLSAPPTTATQPTPKEQVLQRRVDELDQQVKVLGNKQEEAATAAKKDGVKVSAGETGLSVTSADGQHRFGLRGLLQFDGRFYTSDQPGIYDTFLVRRARPIFEGTVFGIYDFRFVPDFGGGRAIVQDAFVDARFKPWAKLRVGKFKVPASLERLQPASETRFVERGYPTNSLVPNRDLGIQLHGEVLERTLEYQAGVFNGAPDGRSSDDFTSEVDNNSNKDLAGRLFAQPFRNGTGPLRGLGFGMSGTYSNVTGRSGATVNETNLPSYRSLAQNIIFSYRVPTATTNGTFAAGNRVRLVPQAYYYWHSLGVIAEYARVSQQVRRAGPTQTRDDRLDHSAWPLATTYVLTGEDNSYRGIKPNNPFRIGGSGWGAIEVGARYTALNLDADSFAGGANSFADPQVSVQSARSWGAVVNWYLNNNVRLQFDYENTRFDGGAAGTGTAVSDRSDEDTIFARFQLVF